MAEAEIMWHDVTFQWNLESCREMEGQPVVPAIFATCLLSIYTLTYKTHVFLPKKQLYRCIQRYMFIYIYICIDVYIYIYILYAAATQNVLPIRRKEACSKTSSESNMYSTLK